MYYTKGIEEIIGTLHHLLGLSEISLKLSDNKLKENYYHFLKKESIFENFNFFENIQFIDFPRLKKIAPTFYVKNKKYFSLNSLVLQQRLSSGFFRNSLYKLQIINTAIFELANFLIKLILVNQLSSYTNGTTDDLIGFASMDFKDHYGEQDFIELVVHQMIHMTLFIDDRCHSHMLREQKNLMIETGLKYVLGGTKFPIYLAFHSYIVGVEVLCFRWQSAGLNTTGIYHGDTSRIIKICRIFQKSLLDHFELFSIRGRSILNDAVLLLDKIIAAYSNLQATL